MKEILLLEDDIAYQETISEYLIDQGYKVDSFSNGSDALDAIYDNSYKLALLDVRVPDISGFEILKEIRKNKIDLSVILITSLVDIDNLSIGYELGCNDYIRKPFDLKELKYRVANALEAVYRVEGKVVELKYDYFFDIENSVLKHRDKEVLLTRKELDLMNYFVLNRSRFVSIDEIWSEVWNAKDVSYTDIRMTISRIRKKTSKDLIILQREIGYKVAN